MNNDRGLKEIFHGRSTELLFSLLRYSLAVTLIASGMLKALNLNATSQTIIHYLSLLEIGYSWCPLRLMAIGVCSGEILIGILALFRMVFHLISPVYVMVMAFFVILTYIDLTSPYGGLESCGCFGELIHLNATETFIKNLVLLAISVTLCVFACANHKQLKSLLCKFATTRN